MSIIKICKKLMFILFIIIFFSHVHAETTIDDIYEEQFNLSGANKLINLLPKEAISSLDRLGISGKNLKEFISISPSKILDEIINESKNKSAAPIKAIMPVIAVILLSAVISSADLSLGNINMNDIMSSISSLCICAFIVTPILKCIISASIAIKSVSRFIICFTPIMAGIMIAAGQPVSASSYQIMMASAGQLISQLCTNFLVPLMNIILGIAIISSISQKLNLDNICDTIYKFIKWCLGITTSIFTALLALQNLVSAPTDNFGAKTAKLMLSGFIPVVGGAIGDAFSTVKSCVKLLKSGVGAFGMIAGTIIFLPPIIECIMWTASLSLCSTVSDILISGKTSVLLKSTNKVIKIMLAIIFSCLTILIISTVIIILIGGGS